MRTQRAWDSEMSKLVPHWGYSPQPGSTYYLHQLNHNLLGIINHSDGTSAIYILMNAQDPITSTMLILDYLCNSGKVPTWIRRLHVFMDNMCSTNKNLHVGLGQWVSPARKILSTFHFLYLVIPNLLLTSFSRGDIVNTSELGDNAGQYAHVNMDNSNKV